jgi:hypothetical protein
MNVVWTIVFIGVFIGLLLYYGFTEQGQKEAAAAREKKARQQQAKTTKQLSRKPGGKVDAPISVVGDQSHLGLACPKCGGSQFKAKRSGKARAGIAVTTVVTGGIGGVAAAGVTRQTKVKCVTCGTEYQRG